VIDWVLKGQISTPAPILFGAAIAIASLGREVMVDKRWAGLGGIVPNCSAG
jgi:hypothetical protein